MANYGGVKTKKKIKPEMVTEILNELNRTVFKNLLSIDYEYDPDGWRGKHNWYVSLKENDRLVLNFWLDTSRSFSVEHRGVIPFMWWIDQFILNEIAVRFDGMKWDDAYAERYRGEPGKYNDYHEYMNRINTIPSGENKIETDKNYRIFQYYGTPDEFLPDDLKGRDMDALMEGRYT